MSDEPKARPVAAWMERVAAEITRGRHVIIHGNVRDLVRWERGFHPLRPALTSLLTAFGYQLVGEYDIVDGLTFTEPGHEQQFERLISGTTPGAAPPADGARGRMAQALHNAPPPALNNPYDVWNAIRRALRQSGVPTAFMVDLADLALPAPDRAGDAEKRLLATVTKTMTEAAQAGSLRNLVVLIADDLGSLPAWLYRERPYINVVKALRPTFEERYVYLKERHRSFHEADRATDVVADLRVLANLSEGMAVTELDGLWRMSRLQRVPLAEPRTLMKRTVLGPRRDPWRQIRTRLTDFTPRLRERVIGQPVAVERVHRALTAATVGIDFVADPHSAESRPKGIFFFVGPTGVGKTELARGLSEFVFDDETALARFDMSTFTEQHAAERLTGAPPGYVGHERGGELTNLVGQRPFSVLLFDEIEKAHASVFDKFLQVLDDGRLTDALGNTVYFSETIIIFTSNLGAKETYGWLDGSSLPDYATVSQHFERSVRDHFTRTLGRPELLGRLGGGITVFDILRPEFVARITRKLLRQLVASAARQQIGLRIDEPAAIEEVQSRLRDPEALRLGVRSIRNVLDERVRDPLVEFVFAHPGQRSITLTVRPGGTDVRAG
ncbi:energy-coupling factor transporter ATP-binding protein EcfA2 [Catenuloplanes nepalensis]|uniref:Energy-coupling factor transporter ATP-binding protein EcfA2 n=1 Tax=Catenuloplanes nepalensis TaxID=587533 RepID=A0ABT9MNW2_9ACTN|nr:AAA family ATPase [Catenuloplanes nepalensis]MDP9793132.1 energy-coupling factor transporter ATP-binding protein EcfA2 [Catenuloplanes nepalensis]